MEGRSCRILQPQPARHVVADTAIRIDRTAHLGKLRKFGIHEAEAGRIEQCVLGEIDAAEHPRDQPFAGFGQFRRELTAAGLDQAIWQCPVVLLADVRSVGVQGDGRTYGHPVVLLPVSSEDAMTADFSRLPYDVLARVSTRITNEVNEINRVVLDITSKPPGTIEWE